MHFHAPPLCVCHVDTIKARSLWHEPVGGWGKGKICAFAQTDTYWCQNDARPWLGRSLSKSQSSIIKDLLQKRFLMQFHIRSLFHSRVWSPWLASKAFQSQHIYVFTLNLRYCCVRSQKAVYRVVSETVVWLSEFGQEKQAFPPQWLPPTISFYPEHLRSYVVMLQLSNNPQLIKYVMSVINFFTSWTEMFSAWKAKVDTFFLFIPCLPVYC